MRMARIVIAGCAIVTLSLASIGRAELVAHWDFNEGSGLSAIDSVNGLVASFLNGASFTTDAREGDYALLVDGVNDYAEVSYDPALDLGTNDLTYAVWAKAAAVHRGFIANVRLDGDNFMEIEWQADSTINSIYEVQNVRQWNLDSVTPLSTGVWVHIAVVVKRGVETKIYINGVDDTENPPAYALSNNMSINSPMDLGRWAGGNYYFNGVIDDFRIYNHALTAFEVNALIVGDLWAKNPRPVIGAMGVPLTTDLSWDAPEDVTSPKYNVYFGAVGNMTQVSLGQTATTYDPTLAGAIEYQWRIDVVEPNTVVHTGEVWNFTSAGLVYDQIPADAAQGVPVDIRLSWTGDGVASDYDVYVGASETAVQNANTGSAEYLGRTSDAFMDITGLSEAVTYFWRVDEVDAGAVLGTGRVLSFETVKLMAYWALDDTGTMVSDSVGGNNGQVNGTYAWVSPGVLGGALDVDGTDGYVEVLDSDDFNVSASGISFSFYLKRDDLSPCFPISQRQGSADFTNVEFIADGRVNLEVNSSGSPYGRAEVYSASPISANQWHHVVLVFNRLYLEDSKVYIDGLDDTGLVPAFDVKEGVVNHVADLNIGRWGGDNYYYNGSIDEIKIYNGPLTEAQAQALFAESELAKYPMPENGKTEVDPTALTLTWTPGANSPMSHQVYLTADTADFTGVTPVSRTMPNYAPPALDVDRQYFWRVDEVYADHIVEGAVWSFTTVPPRAYAESPVSGSSNVAANALLGWTLPPGGPYTVTVYFDYGQGAGLEVIATGAGLTSADPTPSSPVNLTWGQTYTWRVDLENSQLYTGNTWDFTVATNPVCNPPLPGDLDGDCDVDLDDFAQLAGNWLACTLSNGECP